MQLSASLQKGGLSGWLSAHDIVRRYSQARASRHRAKDMGTGASMTTFDEREKEFESRYKHDQELQFKVKARRNRLLGLWAAGRMGLTGEAANNYAKEVVDAEFDGGDPHVVDKVCADLNGKGQNCTPAQVKFELDHLGEQAKQQIMQE
jgi:hypothetical protein